MRSGHRRQRQLPGDGVDHADRRAPAQPPAFRRNLPDLLSRLRRRRRFLPRSGDRCRRAILSPGSPCPPRWSCCFSISIVAADARLLGYGGNLMALSVGWHYVKQGYGMLMVDAVLKRRFFDGSGEEGISGQQLCRLDGFAWLGVNAMRSASSSCGALHYYTFAIPAAGHRHRRRADRGGHRRGGVLRHWARSWRRERRACRSTACSPMPSASMLWLLFVRDRPVCGCSIVPALHSLQYLVVVWPLSS